MNSPIHRLQKAIVEGEQSVTQLLRQAKVIASKLKLVEIEKWVDAELKGYPNGAAAPQYRQITSSELHYQHPQYGWQSAGNLAVHFNAANPISEIEDFSKGERVAIPSPTNLTLQSPLGPNLFSQLSQRIIVYGSEFKRILENVKNELLRLTTELKSSGIIGEDMSFDEEERQKAASVVFNIGTVHGAAGNFSNSPVTVNSHVALYDFSSIQQLLIDSKVPKQDRRELEDIMDELKVAPPQQKPSLMKRAEKWIVSHKELLGVGVELVVKAIGSTGS